MSRLYETTDYHVWKFPDGYRVTTISRTGQIGSWSDLYPSERAARRAFGLVDDSSTPWLWVLLAVVIALLWIVG